MEEIKEKYKVTEEFKAKGKLILILGAGGNWGGHFSLGMPAACGCDALLAESKENKESLDEVIEDIKSSNLPIKTSIEIYEKKDLNDRISLYQNFEKKYGHFSCILDVEGINTNYVFPESQKIKQKPIINKEDMKPRYQVGPNDVLKGKKILIFGPSGNWGSHMAMGMGLLGQADLILVDFENKKEKIEKIKNDIGSRVNINCEFIQINDKYGRYNLYNRMKNLYGKFDAFMDMMGINKD